MSVGEERFAAFFANTPAATLPIGSAPMLVLQAGRTAQVPASSVTVIPPIRTILTANTNFYVATTGSDSNPGTLASPWATLQHAAHFVSTSIDGGGFFSIVNIGAGSFAGYGIEPLLPTTPLSFLGAGSSSTTITDGPNDGVFNFAETVCINAPSRSGISAVKLTNTGALAGAIIDVFFTYTVLGLAPLLSGTTDLIIDVTNMSGFPAINVAAGGPVELYSSFGTVTITGGGASLISLLTISQKCLFEPTGGTWTVSGALTVTQAFVVVQDSSVLAFTTFSGSVTGPRFSVSSNGAVIGGPGGLSGTGSLGPNYFLGSTPGTADASSSYDGFLGPIPNPNKQTGASYTVANADLLGRIEMNNGGANTVTVPLDSVLVGASITRAEFHVTQIGAGATTVAAGAGVTVHNAGAVGGQWKTVLVYWRAANEWVQTNA